MLLVFPPFFFFTTLPSSFVVLPFQRGGVHHAFSIRPDPGDPVDLGISQQ